MSSAQVSIVRCKVEVGNNIYTRLLCVLLAQYSLGKFRSQGDSQKWIWHLKPGVKFSKTDIPHSLLFSQIAGLVANPQLPWVSFPSTYHVLFMAEPVKLAEFQSLRVGMLLDLDIFIFSLCLDFQHVKWLATNNLRLAVKGMLMKSVIELLGSQRWALALCSLSQC